MGLASNEQNLGEIRAQRKEDKSKEQLMMKIRSGRS